MSREQRILECNVDELHRTSTEMDEDTVKGIVDATARFAHELLELRCAPMTASHTLHNDPFRVCSYAELIVHDGNYTFCDYGCRSAYHRQRVEIRRASIESTLYMLTNYAAAYKLLLTSLEEEMHFNGMAPDDTMDLKELVVHPLPTRSYFVQLCLNHEMCAVDASECVTPAAMDHPPVVVGGLANALSVALESAMDRWLHACEDAINTQMFAGAVSKTQYSPSDLHRAGALRKHLRKLLCDHVAMVGMFRRSRTNPGVLERCPGRLTDAFIMDLLNAQLAGDTTGRCEERRRSQLQALGQLARLFRADAREDAIAVVQQHGTEIVSTLNSPPRVLRRRPGFATGNLEVNKLAMVVHGHTSHDLLAKQLDVWRCCVGEATLANVYAMVERSIELVREWRLPENGFLPTMRAIDVPLPTWTDEEAARTGLAEAREGMAMQADTDVDSASCLPHAVESAMRMTSLLWELTGYQETSNVYFENGRVRGGYLHDVVINQSVIADYALSTLIVYKQQMCVGANFRSSDTQIRDFKGSDFEQPLRAAACHLSKVSIGEFFAVASDLSPVHHAHRWRIVDRVGVLLGTSEFARFVGRSAEVVGIALEAAMPIVLAMRSEIGLSSFVRSNPTRDFLLSMARVRNVSRDDTQPLVLTHDDLATSAVPRARERMRSLEQSSGGCIVFGRMPRGANAVHNYGARRVWSIDPSFVRDLLFEHVDAI